MSRRYKGSLIRDTSPTITPATGIAAGGTASGVWSPGQVFQQRGPALWPRTAGENVYTSPGTFSWVAPTGVTSVSVVCVGASVYWANGERYGRGGGGLGYKNNITVVPGNSYEVVVSGSNDGVGSHFINTSTVRGGQGTGSDGGTFTGDGGGNGGNGGANSGTGSGAGGGGAGGYNGNGGNGGASGANSGFAAAVGSGAGGGGAGGTSGSFGGGGGGVGLYGIGADGIAGIYNAASSYEPGGGGGGSGGAVGSMTNTGGGYGAAAYGGGIAGTGATVYGGNTGGAVRIIYPGISRQFPSGAGLTN